MSFRTELHAGISKAIAKHLQLLETSVMLGPLMSDAQNDAWCRTFLRALFESRVFTPEDFREAVTQAVGTYGLAMYQQVLRGEYPDHVTSPQALAYVLRIGVLSPGVASGIRFDHGETLEQFKARSEGLIEKIMKQLTDGPRPLALLPGTDAGTICEGCGQ